MSELIKFVEKFKGEELTHAEFIQLDSLVIVPDEFIFWCFVWALVGAVIGIIVSAIDSNL